MAVERLKKTCLSIYILDWISCVQCRRRYWQYVWQWMTILHPPKLQKEILTVSTCSWCHLHCIPQLNLLAIISFLCSCSKQTPYWTSYHYFFCNFHDFKLANLTIYALDIHKSYLLNWISSRHLCTWTNISEQGNAEYHNPFNSQSRSQKHQSK